MPWDSDDATRHTKKADGPTSKRQWSKVANSILERTGDEGRAVQGANSAVAKRKAKRVGGKFGGMAKGGGR